MISDLIQILDTKKNKSFLKSIKDEWFYDLDSGMLLKDLPTNRPKFVLYKYKSPLIYANLSTTNFNSTLPVGTIYTITSSSVAIGIIFELPRCRIVLQPNYMAVVKEEKKRYNNVSNFYSSKNLNIFCDEDGTALLAIKGRKYENAVKEEF